MKQCKTCGKKVQDKMNSCPKCGSKDLAKVMKRKTKIEIMILVATTVAFIAVVKFLSSYSGGSEAETTTVTTTQTTTQTTTSAEMTTSAEKFGTKKDNVYKNEWIGIKFNIPEGYTETSKDLATDGDTILAYDIALEDRTGKNDVNYFTLHFSNCEKEQEWTDYVEYHKEGTQLMEDLNLEAIDGVKPTDRMQIAGEEYLTVKGREKESGEYFLFAYRKIEDRVIAIMAKGKTHEANEAFISRIEKA